VSRIRSCTDQITRGRLRKAAQFLEAADIVQEGADGEHEIGDAFVTLCVLAGIAAADTICCAALGEHAQGDDHTQATAMLERVRPDGTVLATALGALLAMKTKASYGELPMSGEQRVRAYRRAKQLVDAALRRAGNG
jgi:hypothetical protein